MDAIAPRDTIDGGRAVSNLSPDDYKTPLIRIVDQESMLSGAAFLLRFAQESNDEIQARLASINAENPVLISMVDMNAITEDAIVIRNAIADAISYSNLANNEETCGSPAELPDPDRYISGTSWNTSFLTRNSSA